MLSPTLLQFDLSPEEFLLLSLGFFCVRRPFDHLFFHCLELGSELLPLPPLLCNRLFSSLKLSLRSFSFLLHHVLSLLQGILLLSKVGVCSLKLLVAHLVHNFTLLLRVCCSSCTGRSQVHLHLAHVYLRGTIVSLLLQQRLEPGYLLLELTKHRILGVLIDFGFIFDVLRPIRVPEGGDSLVIVVVSGPHVGHHDSLGVSSQGVLQQPRQL
mmetsp:Transcript_42244/g.66166  ORF Transcript_42244/g.66166 Transcript_42244/m.66166 type:complete len:212 (-) Transcript_42244:41-676(-)